MKTDNFLVIVSGLLSVLMLMTAVRAATTDDELEALEQQIEQQEKEQAEANRRAEIEAKRREEEERRVTAEAEKQKMEAERLQAEQDRQEIYKKHFVSAEQFMNDDKFDMAIQEYQKILDIFPEDAEILDAVSKAKKYLTACNEFAGTWSVEPNAMTWQAHPDHTIFGKWLIFSSNGFWECASPRDREFVTSWPDCPVCKNDYFILSDDGNTFQGIRDSKGLHGKRIDNSR